MNSEMMIAAEAVSAITVTVVGITQLVKWAGLPAKHAPLILAALSVSAVLLYVYKPFVYGIIVASTAIMMAASGIYGFANRTGKPEPVSAALPEPPATASPAPAPSPAQPEVVIPSQASADSSEGRTA